MKDVEVYAVGLVSMSLCTSLDDVKEIELLANLENKAGTMNGRRLSKDTHFAQGSINPCPCDKYPERMHYLLDC